MQSTGIAYWEGMIDVAGPAGKSGSQAVRGSGYLEMTGYHGSLGRVLSGSVRSCGLAGYGLAESS